MCDKISGLDILLMEQKIQSMVIEEDDEYRDGTKLTMTLENSVFVFPCPARMFQKVYELVKEEG